MSNQLSAFNAIPFSPATLANKPKRNLERGYASRLQLVATGTSGLAMDEKCKVGNYALVDGDEAIDLGNDLTVVPLVRLDKAVDFSGDDVEVAFGVDNPRYVDIAGRSDRDGYDSGCMYGPVYLVFETGTGQFLELFLNSKSTRREDSSLIPFLPVSQEAAAQYDCEPRAPQMVSLSSKKLERGKNKWYVPVVKEGPPSVDIADPPTPEEITTACLNFVKQTEAEKVEEETRSR